VAEIRISGPTIAVAAERQGLPDLKTEAEAEPDYVERCNVTMDADFNLFPREAL
jgi:hypothetical protein